MHISFPPSVYWLDSHASVSDLGIGIFSGARKLVTLRSHDWGCVGKHRMIKDKSFHVSILIPVCCLQGRLSVPWLPDISSGLLCCAVAATCLRRILK